MTEKATDSKVRIQQEFKTLVSKKSLSKVTVSEIIRACNINRKTFYYYFEDIYDLLRQTLQQEAIEMVSHFDFITEFDAAIAFITAYIEKNHAFLKHVYNSVRREELKRIFYRDFVQVFTQILNAKTGTQATDLSDGFQAFAIRFYTEAVASVMVDLIIEYPRVDTAQTAAYLSKIINTATAALSADTATE